MLIACPDTLGVTNCPKAGKYTWLTVAIDISTGKVTLTTSLFTTLTFTTNDIDNYVVVLIVVLTADKAPKVSEPAVIPLTEVVHCDIDFVPSLAIISRLP